MTNEDLNTIFGNHWSRNEPNAITALHEAGFSLENLEWLIEIGAVVKLQYGDQVHYERRVTSQRSFEKLFENITT